MLLTVVAALWIVLGCIVLYPYLKCKYFTDNHDGEQVIRCGVSILAAMTVVYITALPLLIFTIISLIIVAFSGSSPQQTMGGGRRK